MVLYETNTLDMPTVLHSHNRIADGVQHTLALRGGQIAIAQVLEFEVSFQNKRATYPVIIH